MRPLHHFLLTHFLTLCSHFFLFSFPFSLSYPFSFLRFFLSLFYSPLHLPPTSSSSLNTPLSSLHSALCPSPTPLQARSNFELIPPPATSPFLKAPSSSPPTAYAPRTTDRSYPPPRTRPPHAHRFTEGSRTKSHPPFSSRSRGRGDLQV